MNQSLVILIFAVALSGCAGFVQTQKIDNTGITSGISYYLPKRMHRLIVTANILDPETQKKEFNEAAKLSGALSAEAKKLKSEWTKLKLVAENTPTGKAKDDADKAAQLAEGNYNAAGILAKLSIDAKEEAKRKYDLARNFSSRKCNYDISMKVLPQPLEPDIRHPFTLIMAHSFFRDDELFIKTTSSGLLSNLDVTTTDRTGDVVVEIAKAVAIFAGGLPITPGVTAPPKVRGAAPPPTLPVKECIPTELRYDDVVDFADAPIEVLLKDNGGYPPDTTKYDVPENLTIGIRESGYIGTNLADKKSPLSKMCEGDSDTRKECVRPNGLLYRRDETFLVQLKRVDKTVLAAAQISMPNLSPVSIVPFEALSLVTTKNKTVFENGMLVSHDTNLPSQALGIAKIPTRVVEGMLGAITNFLQLKIDYTKKQTDLADQRTKLNDASKKLDP